VTKINNKRKNEKKQLKAEEMYKLVSETLEEELDWKMKKRNYEVRDICDVLIGAAVEQMSIEMASHLLEKAPSGTTVRTIIKEMLTDMGQWEKVEEKMNQLLTRRLPKKLLKSKLPAAIDITEVPYHGQEAEADEMVRRGRAKSGTTHFFAFATLYVVKKNKRYTLSITLMAKKEKAQDVLERLLCHSEQLGLRLKRLYLDRGFDNNGVVAYLKQKPFPIIIPLTIRGKQGGSRALMVGRKSRTTTYERRSTIYDDQTLTLHIVCKYSKGKYKRQGVYRFAYIVIGSLCCQPLHIAEEYRLRFGIETSYRLMNQIRVRTTCTIARFRFFLVTLAFLLLNLWIFVKWAYLFIPQRGPRVILHHLLPLTLFRLWLWDIVKLRLGFSLAIHLPLNP